MTEDYKNPEYYWNRELSWLEFNYRILGEARDKTNPLFERLKFLSITASNPVSYTHLIDVGGESTRPGHSPVSAEEELERVVPVIRLLKQELDIPVSVDTFKAEVAEAALEAGADMVNDIWGLKADPDMAAVIAAGNVPCCLMHNRKEAVYQSCLLYTSTSRPREIRMPAQREAIRSRRLFFTFPSNSRHPIFSTRLTMGVSR